MSVKNLVTTAIILLVSRGAAVGQTIPSPYEFFETRQEASAFSGRINPGTGQFGYGPGPGPMFGVRYGLELSGPLSVDGVVSLIPTSREVVDPQRREGDRMIGTADVRLVTAEARFKLSLTGARTWHHINPFVFAGAGAAWDLATSSLVELGLAPADQFKFGTAFLGVLGGGVRWFVGDQWVVRGDGALHLWKLDAPSGFQLVERGFSAVGSSEWANATSFSIALGYRF